MGDEQEIRWPHEIAATVGLAAVIAVAAWWSVWVAWRGPRALTRNEVRMLARDWIGWIVERLFGSEWWR